MQQLGAAAAAAADRSRSFSLPHSALSHSHLTPRSLPATRASPISLMHHSSNQRRALFAGLPPREQALQAQRRNLEAFVQEHAEAYAALPYEPFTRVNPKLKFSVATKVAPSSLSGCRGLHGVILQEIVDTRDEPRGGRSLCYYPGLLVTERLYNIFSRKYHCPTALEIPALTYREPGDDEDKPMLIIGDPTSHGAIINDGVRSKVKGQFALDIMQASAATLRSTVLTDCPLALRCPMCSQLQAAVREGEGPQRHSAIQQEDRQTLRGRSDRCCVRTAWTSAASR